MAAYFVMGLIASRCVNHRVKNVFIKNLTILGFCSAYGALDEWHQSFVPGRDADLLDWTADVAGAICALILLRLSKQQRVRKKTSRS